MMRIFLFDVDGTLVESGEKISGEMVKILTELSIYGDLGIVGGGTYNKISNQLGDEALKLFKYVFAESGSSYYKDGILLHQNDIRTHPSYTLINRLKKVALRYLSGLEGYELSGTILDQRSGLLYISLIGMQATPSERKNFIQLDSVHNYRTTLLSILKKDAGNDDSLEITLGGSVGIGIYPKEWNKGQVLKYISEYDTIYYFGDKYLPNGNDYPLLFNDRVNGICVDNPEMTIDKISTLHGNTTNKN